MGTSRILHVLVVILMSSLSEKRKELLQTVASLMGLIRAEKGCQRCDFCQSTKDENALCLLEEWDTHENLLLHLRSGSFSVLRGAATLLHEPYEMMIYTVLYPSEIKKICGYSVNP